MVGKKGYLRTLEAVLALVLTFTFIYYIMPSPYNALSDSNDNEYLMSLIDNEKFRGYAINLSACIEKGDINNITLILDDSISSDVNYIICPDGIKPVLPKKKVNAESIYLTGNITDFHDKKIIRLYYFT